MPGAHCQPSPESRRAGAKLGSQGRQPSLFYTSRVTRQGQAGNTGREDLAASAPTGPRVVATSGVRRRRTELVEERRIDPAAPAGRRRLDLRPSGARSKKNATPFHGFRSSAYGGLTAPVATATAQSPSGACDPLGCVSRNTRTASQRCPHTVRKRATRCVEQRGLAPLATRCCPLRG